MSLSERKNQLFIAAAIALIALIVWVASGRREGANVITPSTAPSTAAASAGTPSPAVSGVAVSHTARRENFVGSAACASCHAVQANAYAKSHHALALVVTKPEDVKAQLASPSFSSPLGGGTRFSEKNGAFEVTTPDAKGRSTTFPVAYTSGVWPLLQYVVATERGRLQSLGVVWDSRTKSDGGERWFHVYGPRGIAHGDELYFTRAAQNWNHVCADCHSTFVERRYDLAADGFDTRWAELSVGCEACHGPGGQHVRLAKAGVKGGAWENAKGLAVTLQPAPAWAPSSTGSPVPRRPDTVEIEVCAPCHSRREPLHEGFIASDALLDAFAPELLRPGRYHADGQVEGEVYEWGSFLQSRMHAAGVRCSDCHEPHAAKLRANGNELCARCHAPARFEQVSHSHHEGDKAPLCIDCHMPPATFMEIDERRDHSIRIPRPDLSVLFGTPNACNGCHSKQDATWARDSASKWWPGAQGRPHFVEALARDRKGALDAPLALAALAREPTVPAIARATALERLGSYRSKHARETLAAALTSDEPLVVYGAVLGVSALPLAARVPLLLAAVTHRMRAVRVAAGQALAGVPLTELEPKARNSVERAFAEVEESFTVSASLPQAHVERSSFLLTRGNAEEAEKELHTALRLAPCLAEAHLNLADLSRARRDEARAEQEIREALKCAPTHAAAHHALGLWAVRAKDTKTALASLRKAVELAPNELRFAYVLAVAIAEDGDLPAALVVIDRALAQRPSDTDLLQAALTYRTRLGQVEAVADAKRKLDALLRE